MSNFSKNPILNAILKEMSLKRIGKIIDENQQWLNRVADINIPMQDQNGNIQYVSFRLSPLDLALYYFYRYQEKASKELNNKLFKMLLKKGADANLKIDTSQIPKDDKVIKKYPKSSSVLERIMLFEDFQMLKVYLKVTRKNLTYRQLINLLKLKDKSVTERMINQDKQFYIYEQVYRLAVKNYWRTFNNLAGKNKYLYDKIKNRELDAYTLTPFIKWPSNAINQTVIHYSFQPVNVEKFANYAGYNGNVSYFSHFKYLGIEGQLKQIIEESLKSIQSVINIKFMPTDNSSHANLSFFISNVINNHKNKGNRAVTLRDMDEGNYNIRAVVIIFPMGTTLVNKTEFKLAREHGIYSDSTFFSPATKIEINRQAKYFNNISHFFTTTSFQQTSQKKQADFFANLVEINLGQFIVTHEILHGLGLSHSPMTKAHQNCLTVMHFHSALSSCNKYMGHYHLLDLLPSDYKHLMALYGKNLATDMTSKFYKMDGSQKTIQLLHQDSMIDLQQCNTVKINFNQLDKANYCDKALFYFASDKLHNAMVFNHDAQVSISLSATSNHSMMLINLNPYKATINCGNDAVKVQRNLDYAHGVNIFCLNDSLNTMANILITHHESNHYPYANISFIKTTANLMVIKDPMSCPFEVAPYGYHNSSDSNSLLPDNAISLLMPLMVLLFMIGHYLLPDSRNNNRNGCDTVGNKKVLFNTSAITLFRPATANTDPISFSEEGHLTNQIVIR